MGESEREYRYDSPFQALKGPKFKLLEAFRRNAGRVRKAEISQLINAGADVNATDKEGKTALFYASRRERNEDVVVALIDAGADVNITDNEGKTALFFANEGWGYSSVVNPLIDAGADVDKTDNEGKTALSCAVLDGKNSYFFYALIGAGADVDKIDNEGKTALFYAVQPPTSPVQQSYQKIMVNALIAAGADVNKVDNEGKTALFYASHVQFSQYLVRAGTNVNMTDNKGKTALFYTVQQRDNASMVRALINAGADVNITDSEGKTALFYVSAQKGNIGNSVVQALIAAGADVNKTNNEDKTSLHQAWEDSNEPLVLQLIQQGADVKVLNDVNITDEEGKTLLIRAIKGGYLNSAEKIARGGADVDIVDKEGKTALFYAVLQDSKKVVNVLIDTGADVNITDKEGKTALFYANEGNDFQAVVLALIDAGALLMVRDHYGNTPLFYAVTKSTTLTVTLLGGLERRKNYHSVLTFFIQECYKFPGDLQTILQILVQKKIIGKSEILKAIVSVAFCKILSFNQSSRSIDVLSISALLKLAKDYTSFFDAQKQVAFRKVLKTVEGQRKKVLMEEGVISKLLLHLVKLGANPNSVDSDGNTALHHAIHLSLYGVPKLTVLHICYQLGKMGVSFHKKNLRSETPILHCLVSMITKLSSHGKQQWSEVQTQLSVCQFLIIHGSNLEEKEQYGKSALYLILELLRQVLLKAYSEARTKCVDDLVRIFQQMLSIHKKKELPLIIKDDKGNTPLHVLATFRLPHGQDYSSTITEGHTFKGLLKLIFDHFTNDNKPQLHVKNEDGETPLHLCRTWCAIELLLDAGANPNDVDSSGCSPLLVAAKNNKVMKNQDLLYPDIILPAQDKFWRKILDKGFDPWAVDINNESVLSVLMESELHDLGRALIQVACDDSKVQSCHLILFSLLTAICRDKLPNAQWKEDAAKKILSLTKCPVNGNDRQDSPLHYCCRNIIEAKKGLSIDELQLTVHWRLVELLRSFGADYKILDAAGQSCLDIAEECHALKELLIEPIDLDKFPLEIKPWKSVSKSHERCLTKVVRHLESKHVEPYWYHQDPLACGSFGAVYAGINEKDGREVAIKRVEKIRMLRPEDQREITNLTALSDCEQVVRYLSFFEDKDFSYIVLELMEGNLEDLLNKSITMKEREELCSDVIKGLSYMHGKGCLHRDLKPSNILFKNSPKLCLKIADFGLSLRSDSPQLTTVYGTNAGTRCWIAPEVIKATKGQHSAASDMFSCGLVLHYFLSVKKHPFYPDDCRNKGELQICAETETNIMSDRKEGWDDSFSPEATHLLKQLLESDARKRPTASKSLTYPLFWSKPKKMDILIALGNQHEFECPRSKKTSPLSPVENDLEASIGTIVKCVDWSGRHCGQMPAIYAEMTKKRTGYNTCSVVELVRFIRNAYSHVSERARPTPIRKLLLEDFVFLEYFPNLVIEVYKAVTTHGWDETREEIKYAMEKYEARRMDHMAYMVASLYIDHTQKRSVP